MGRGRNRRVCSPNMVMLEIARFWSSTRSSTVLGVQQGESRANDPMQHAAVVPRQRVPCVQYWHVV